MVGKGGGGTIAGSSGERGRELTGYILRKQLPPLLNALLPTNRQGIPKRFYTQIFILPRHNRDITSSSGTDLGPIARQLDIHIRHHSRVLCRIRDINVRLERERRLGRIQDAEGSHFGGKAIEVAARYSWITHDEPSAFVEEICHILLIIHKVVKSVMEIWKTNA